MRHGGDDSSLAPTPSGSIPTQSGRDLKPNPEGRRGIHVERGLPGRLPPSPSMHVQRSMNGMHAWDSKLQSRSRACPVGPARSCPSTRHRAVAQPNIMGHSANHSPSSPSSAAPHFAASTGHDSLRAICSIGVPLRSESVGRGLAIPSDDSHRTQCRLSLPFR
jgi:hypothetical protein